jgi:hypothetical protein
VSKGDAAPRLRRAGEVLADRIVDREATILGQQHDAGGEELLAHRPDLEDGLRSDRDPVLEIRHAVPLRLDQLAAAYDGERHAGNAHARHRVGDEPVDRVGRGLAGRLGAEGGALRADGKCEREDAMRHEGSPSMVPTKVPAATTGVTSAVESGGGPAPAGTMFAILPATRGRNLPVRPCGLTFLCAHAGALPRRKGR